MTPDAVLTQARFFALDSLVQELNTMKEAEEERIKIDEEKETKQREVLLEKESLLLILAQREVEEKKRKDSIDSYFPDVERLQLEKKKATLEVDLLQAQIWKAEKEKRLYN